MFGSSYFKKYLIIVSFLVGISYSTTVFAHGGQVLFSSSGQEIVPMKDSDMDGVTDNAEINSYKTNPNNPDTDGDRILDYQEILDKTDPTDSKSNLASNLQTVDSLLPANSPIFWYIGRISGISAFLMFTVVVMFGLLMTSKFLLKFRIFSAPDALATHSFNATFLGLVLVVIHITSFMLDDVIRLSFADILIPFYVKRDITSALGYNISIPISLGIIAFYLAVILVVTSQFRKKIVSLRIWRSIHYSSFLFYILFMAHGILAGSDTNEVWMKSLYIGSGTIVFLLILLRIFGKKYFISSLRPKQTAAMPTASISVPSQEKPHLDSIIPAQETVK